MLINLLTEASQTARGGGKSTVRVESTSIAAMYGTDSLSLQPRVRTIGSVHRFLTAGAQVREYREYPESYKSNGRY